MDSTNDARYAGRRAVVVGGTHGVGLAIAEALVAGGAQVVVTGRDPDRAAEAGRRLGASATSLASDVADATARDALAETVRERLGGVDALFVNVGAAELEPFEAVTEASWDRQLDVNAKGAFFVAQRLVPLVERGGGVVFTTVTAATASPGMAVFMASKAAVRAFAGVIAAEVVERGVRVNTVAPGFVDTPTLGIAGLDDAARAELHAVGDAVTPMHRHGSADEVARAAIFLALEATFSTGTELQVDGGLSSVDAP